MLQEILLTLFTRDLNKLKQEINAYKNEAAIWRTDKAIANCAGNLCLHLVGNLNAYMGTVLGNTGYIRNRELEFSRKDVPAKELVEMIESTLEVIQRIVPGLTEEQLSAEYPLLVFDKKTTTAYMLVHLATHLAYHLGQVNYHRRLLD
jgi:uncharacterized damage-inducible protein DinB